MHANLEVAHLGALDGSRTIGHVAHGAVGGTIPQLKVVELFGLGLILMVATVCSEPSALCSVAVTVPVALS